MTRLLLDTSILVTAERDCAGRAAFVADVRRTLPVLAYDAKVAARHAQLLAAVRRAGRPRGAHDLIIAATAAAWDRSVVTGDTAAFDGLDGLEGVTILPIGAARG